ncbi:hypothetical protein JCM10213_001953 [Rhodosporidiobolus nylandii]
MSRYTPYCDSPSSPPPVKRWRRSTAPLRSTSAANSPAASPVARGADVKGKGKAKERAAGRTRHEEAWKGVDALLSQSFTLHRLNFPSSAPFSTAASVADLARFSSVLRTYLRQQLSLGLEPDVAVGEQDTLVERVEAGFLDLPMFGKAGSAVRPVMLEVERNLEGDTQEASTSSAAPTSRTSTFVFLPSASESSAYTLLLTKSPSPAISTLVHRFLATRHDATLLPFRIPPPSMLDILEDLVLNRDKSFDGVEAEVEAGDKGLATNLTLAFPSAVAKDGLSTLTLTLPPPILPFLSPPTSTSFTAGLSAHLHSITSLSLSALSLVRLGAGRGTFIHSGQGAGEGSAKVKFFRGAEEEGELRRPSSPPSLCGLTYAISLASSLSSPGTLLFLPSALRCRYERSLSASMHLLALEPADEMLFSLFLLAMSAASLTGADRKGHAHDPSGAALLPKFAGSSCVGKHPASGAPVFHREHFEKRTLLKREWCFRKLYYSDFDYAVSYENELLLPAGGKLWNSFAVDVNSTTYFYLELCYEDYELSKFKLLSFDEEIQDVSRDIMFVRAGLEMTVAAAGEVGARVGGGVGGKMA